MSKTVSIIGRGHSATRLITKTLMKSGFFMGDHVNRKTADKKPYKVMYKVAGEAIKRVKMVNESEWDFSELVNGKIPRRIRRLINAYLEDIQKSESLLKGWKLPETTFVYPWLVRLYPEFHYLQWLRSPNENKPHYSERLLINWGFFDLENGEWKNEEYNKNRALGWKLQYDIVNQTPRPKNFLQMKMEDFILHQDRELDKLKSFLGVDLKKIPVKKDVLGSFKCPAPKYEFLREPMRELDYLI